MNLIKRFLMASFLSVTCAGIINAIFSIAIHKQAFNLLDFIGVSCWFYLFFDLVIKALEKYVNE